MRRLKSNEHIWLHGRAEPALLTFFMRRPRAHAEAPDLPREVLARTPGSDITKGASSSDILQITQNLRIVPDHGACVDARPWGRRLRFSAMSRVFSP